MSTNKSSIYLSIYLIVSGQTICSLECRLYHGFGNLVVSEILLSRSCIRQGSIFLLLVVNKESSKVCVAIKPGRRVKLNRSQIVSVQIPLTIRYLLTDMIFSISGLFKILIQFQNTCSIVGNILSLLCLKFPKSVIMHSF